MSIPANLFKPSLVDALALHQQGQLSHAEVIYRQVLKLEPRNADALHLLGVIFKQRGDYQNSINIIGQAIEVNPRVASYYSNLGLALQGLKQVGAAIESYDKAINLSLDYAEAYSNRGNALQELQKYDEAINSYDKAISLKPNYFEAHSNRGNALKELKQLDAALASYDKAIDLCPEYAEAYANRGNVLKELKQFDAAVGNYDKAIRLKPDLPYLLGMRQYARMAVGNWQKFDSTILELRQKIHLKEKISPCLPALALPIMPTEMQKVAQVWSKDNYPFDPSLGLIVKSARENRIRIGYYSADFVDHPVSILTVGLFELHDKSKFELVAFSYGPESHDGLRGRIKTAFDQFIDAQSMSNKEIAVLSRKLEIDIAIDLGGHTEGGRTGIFAYRAAPIQLSYIGYLGTMGADYYDYLIADRTIIPVESQIYYCEKIVYLPSYQVNDSTQQIPVASFTRQDLKLPSEGFVYCCFNASYKITSSTFDGWMRILTAVPKSVLLLYASNQSVENNLKSEAEKRGVNPSRLIFGEKLKREAYLARYRAADLFLDTLPYNAGATASDALWAGLPVLTCMGDSFASRVAGSLLYAIGLSELVTETQSDYEALAIELGNNPGKVKALKEKLEMNRLTTPLFDTQQFTKNIEAAYTKMYDRYHSDLPPDHIYIEP